MTLDLCHGLSNAARQGHASGGDSKNDEVVAAPRVLDDFMRDASDRAADVSLVKDHACSRQENHLPRLTGRA